MEEFLIECKVSENSPSTDQGFDDDMENSQKRQKYKQKYKIEWEATRSWLVKSNQSHHRAYCKLCNKSLENNKTHLERHAASLFHRKKEADFKNQTLTSTALEKQINYQAENDNKLIQECDDKPSRKRSKKCSETQEFRSLPHKHLQQPTNEYDIISAAWAVELQKMAPHQQLFAKKAINDILFEGQIGTLHRDSVQINNSSCTSMPYSIVVPNPIVQHNNSESEISQHTEEAEE